MTAAGTTTDAGADVRVRLVEAMASAVADKGYPATTIADVVARAHVSRRTFYERFEDKDTCLAACYAVLRDHMLAAISADPAEGVDAPTHIGRAVDALVAALVGTPTYTLAYYLTFQAAGPRARTARRQSQDLLGRALRDLAAQHRARDERVRVPSTMMATALVGGIGELIVHTLERSDIADLVTIAPTVTELITSVLLKGS